MFVRVCVCVCVYIASGRCWIEGVDGVGSSCLRGQRGGSEVMHTLAVRYEEEGGKEVA